MVTFNYFGYLPTRFHSENEDILRVQKLIFDFKSGVRDAVYFASHMIINSFRHSYGSKAEQFCFVCAPCSTQAKYDRRFKMFSSILSSKLGGADASSHVHIIGYRESLHNTPNHLANEDNYRVVLDNDFFAGRKVIIFDDLMTTGTTSNRFADMLTDAGAEVAGAMFLALTYHKGVSNDSDFFAKDFSCQYSNERVEKYINKRINK